MEIGVRPLRNMKQHKRMKKLTGTLLLVGKASDCPDLEYATGFRAVDPVVFVQSGESQYLVVPELEVGRARRESDSSAFREHHSTVNWRVEVLSPKMLGITEQKRGRLSEWALRLLKRLETVAVNVPPWFPHGVAERLERRGVRVSVSKEDLFPDRGVKTLYEIANITQSQQAAVIAMRTAIALIADSEIDQNDYLRNGSKFVTSEDVRRVIEEVLVEHDCFCGETIVAGGTQSADPHERGSGPLRAHEPIVMDIFPRHLEHGYWGDLTRTVIKGRPSATLRKMYAAVKAAQSAALTCLKPYVRCATVHRRATQEVKRRGFRTGTESGRPFGFIHGTGHGVGLAIHEAPSLGLADGRLKAGNVVTVEPGLYYPDVGGIRIEDTVVVTPEGWRYLVPCEKNFEL
jgi:Xaa-Pro aminopeptidase